MGHGSILRQYAGAITRPDALHGNQTAAYHETEAFRHRAWVNTLGFTGSGTTLNGYIKLRNHYDLVFRVQEWGAIAFIKYEKLSEGLYGTLIL